MRTDDEILDGLRAREDWAAEVVRERITPIVRRPRSLEYRGKTVHSPRSPSRS